jgi:hypothetical protein
VVSQASSGAKAQEPDSGVDMESQASFEAEAQEPDSGMDLNSKRSIILVYIHPHCLAAM